MTTVLDFRAYYLRRVWREGDTALISDFPLLVKEAEARISRDIREQSLSAVLDVSVPPGDSYIDLPPDFGEVVSVSVDGTAPLTLLAFSVFNQLDTQHRSGAYSIMGNKLHWSRANSGVTEAVQLVYYMKLSPMSFSAEGAEAEFYDLHPDFFLAALDVQYYTYMRDFDLSAESNGKYDALLETMRRNSNYAMFPSGQLPSPLEYVAPKRSYASTVTGGNGDQGAGTDYVAIYQQAQE